MMSDSSEPVRYTGFLPVTGQCMAYPLRDGERCTRRVAYELTIQFVDGRVVDKIMWCARCTGGLRREHPDQILSLLSVP